MSYETILTEYQRLENRINTLQTELESFPSGKLICSHNKKYLKWYHRDGDHLTYISKGNLVLAENLALKHYLTLQLEHLIHEKRAMESYLKHFKNYQNKSIMLLSEESDYANLLTPHFKSFSDNLTSWITATYEKNPNYPEQLIHKTLSGNLVRSKSEAMIDMMLYQNKIPFRYECAFYLSDNIVYPDFMIKHPITGKIIIWEHFGIMDDQTYYQKAIVKLQNYISHGIIPNVNLITTYESKDNPLTTEAIEKVIQFHFK